MQFLYWITKVNTLAISATFHSIINSLGFKAGTKTLLTLFSRKQAAAGGKGILIADSKARKEKRPF